MIRKKLNELDIDVSYSTTQDDDKSPVDFYASVIPHCKEVYIRLGYFTSYALSILAIPLTEFIMGDGKMFIITNHYLTKDDLENLIDYDISDKKINELDELYHKDPRVLKEFLQKGSQQFYDCCNYLQHKGRLTIQPVFFTGNESDSHQKEYIGTDGENFVLTNGSNNLTANGLLINAESFGVSKSWKDEDVKIKAISRIGRFKEILSNSHDEEFPWVPKERLFEFIHKKAKENELDKILENGKKILPGYRKQLKDIADKIQDKICSTFDENVETFLKSPRRPDWFSPRPYQLEAYNNWVKRSRKGFFVMATGTGKTLTTLNILLEEYLKNGFYQVVILVPTDILRSQWTEEIRNFNFLNVFTNKDNNWENELSDILLNEQLNVKVNFIFIATYRTFTSNKFQSKFKSEFLNDLTFVADEAHNLGTQNCLNNLLSNVSCRIGLSATPLRQFDDIGTNSLLEYFNCTVSNFTYEFTMAQAIPKYLCAYNYSPHFVSLDVDELKRYQEISFELIQPRYFDFEKGVYKENAKFLLIERKRVIHKAKAKIVELSKILDGIKEAQGSVKNTIVYVPEGYDRNESGVEEVDSHIINDYTKAIDAKGIRVRQVLGGKSKDEIIDLFVNEQYHVLTAMKTLDEGVNIPTIRNAIFCASTGNPRQYIQRRGRILRKHKDKEIANIYDLIVVPNESYPAAYSEADIDLLRKNENKIFRSELKRVANFFKLASNNSSLHIRDNDNINRLLELCDMYEFNIFELINES